MRAIVSIAVAVIVGSCSLTGHEDADGEYSSLGPALDLTIVELEA